MQNDRGRGTSSGRSQLCFHLQSYHFPGNASPDQKPFAKKLIFTCKVTILGHLSELVCWYSTSFLFAEMYGFYKMHTLTGQQAHCQKRKIGVSGSLEHKTHVLYEQRIDKA